MVEITAEQMREITEDLCKQIRELADVLERPPAIYFIPTAGYKVAELLEANSVTFSTVYTPNVADIFLDDIIDSGETCDNFRKLYPDTRFVALLNKKKEYDENAIAHWYTKDWVKIFPSDDNIESNVTRLIEYIGEDPTREGLVDTPKRVVKSYQRLFGGYDQRAEDVLKTCFDEKSDEMVLLKDIELYSTCEHHMLPFHGSVHIAYIPQGKVVGISKLARLVEVFARRLQIQERLVNQIAEAIEQHLKPKGVMVVAEAQHFCMTSRGVEKQKSIMVTSAVRGVFRDKQAARDEFLALIRR